MGQKVNPHGFRVGPTLAKSWDSILYAEKNYKDLLLQDIKIRALIIKNHAQSQISRVIIERPSNNNIVINIHAKKPGVIIGKSGNDIEKLKQDIQKIFTGEIYINIHEVKKPTLDAAIISQTITSQLEKRVSFRKAMKMAIQACLKQGGLGIKISCSGRLGGAEIARTEWYREGRVPLHTLRADIDYSTSKAMTTYGVIGVKVWVYKGDCSEVKKKYN
ncbi:MAG: 30S ribosomal protein S3 [Rickettsiaceae bacterium]|nr:MAG: 30S ribosomal protein S3 [Rickettsiaceae bacterium]